MEEILKWFTDGKNLSGAGSIISGLGQGYGLLQQDKAARRMLNLQEAGYNDDLARRKKTQLNLDAAFAAPATVPSLNLIQGV